MNARCIRIGLTLLAFGIAVRWHASGLPAVERSALLLGVHVAAMTVLSAGVLGLKAGLAGPVGLFWSAAGAVLECSQHPVVLRQALDFLAQKPDDSLLADGVALLVLNAQFSPAEVLCALLGGWLGLAVIGSVERSS